MPKKEQDSTSVRPISPKDVLEVKMKTIPDAAIEAFNELIVKKLRGNSAIILQREVVALMGEKGPEKSNVFEEGWLDVEDIYRQAGWKVDYDKPGFNESYEPSFTFSIATKKPR